MSFLSEEGVSGVNDEENQVLKAGAVDPLAEADVYLAYDRDEQAIQVLKEAYSENPERGELAEKLLHIYHKQDDRRAFDNLAADVYKNIDSLQNISWEKVVSMGREVSPDNVLYTAGGVVEEDANEIDIDDEMFTSDDQGSKEEDSGISPSEILEVDESISGVLDMDDIGSENIVKEPPPGQVDTPTLSHMISERAVRETNVEDSVDAPHIEDSQSIEIESLLSEISESLSQEGTQEGVSAEVESSDPTSENVIIDQRRHSEVEIDDQRESQITEQTEQSEESISQLEPYHESETALELAKAYLELGEQEIAKGFIEEVLNDGSDKQKDKARKLIKELAG